MSRLLKPLEDITDKLIFEDEPSIFNDETTIQLFESSMLLIDEYITDNPEVVNNKFFYSILLEEITNIFYIQMEDQIKNLNFGYNFIEEELNNLLEDVVDIYFNTFYPNKIFTFDYEDEDDIDIDDIDIDDIDIDEDSDSIDENINIVESVETDCLKMDFNEDIEKKIQKLRDIPQPVQRTPEWYKFRWNLITASNAWKAFGTQASINQIIYEKCQPLKEIVESSTDEAKPVNVNSPLHWGQKYEPLTVMVYENQYGTKVEDFGCIQHDTYKFLGASPDGIIVNKESDRYGRMLEIKNVVSREITGIPKKEYWTQMQLQMEVCDLDMCDFLETKFIEYPDSNSFNDDILDEQNICLSKDNKIKGEIIYFHSKEGPRYIYKPLTYTQQDEIDKWKNTTIDTYEKEPYNYVYIKTLYWKLQVISCILVMRDRNWFKNSIGQLETVWNIIEKERITGYEHRAPNKRYTTTGKRYTEPESESLGCLLPFKKIVKLNDT
jgi:putative phage-type endonuclease